MNYTTHLKVAQILADVVLEECPFNTDKFIGSKPGAKYICDRVGISNELIVKMVELFLYHAYTYTSDELMRVSITDET